MLASKSDQELIELYTKDSDQDAFVALLLRYKGLIESQSLALMGRAADADDLSQEVALALMQKIHQFKGRSSFSTWLYQLTYNMGVDALRKRMRYERRKRDSSIIDFVQSPKKRTIDSEFYRLIGELDPEERMLVYLRTHRDLSFSEIARVFGKNEQAVKMKWYRLLQELKKDLPVSYQDLVGYEYV